MRRLVASLDANEPAKRADAARALGELHDPCAVEPLLAVAAQATIHYEVHDAAQDALVALGEPAVEPLIAALGSGDRFVRRSAAYALGGLGDARAVQPLDVALRDEENFVKAAAATALARIGEAAFEALVSALGDPNWLVRREAARALGELGDKRAIEPLARLACEDLHFREYQSTEEYFVQEGYPVREAADKAIDALAVGSNPLATQVPRDGN